MLHNVAKYLQEEDFELRNEEAKNVDLHGSENGEAEDYSGEESEDDNDNPSKIAIRRRGQERRNRIADLINTR